MSTEIQSSFSRFEMTPAEELAAAVFTYLQKQYIHNLRTQVAESLINLDDDVEKPLANVKQRARYQGMLDAYAGLVNLSDSAEITLNQLNQGQ